jgi:hypothetical protein
LLAVVAFKPELEQNESNSTREPSGIKTFEDEICMFPRGKHDDQVDSFAYLGMLLDKVLEAPTTQEIADEEYYNELDRSDEYRGRSRVTGY